jgi:hypothetical protein
LTIEVPEKGNNLVSIALSEFIPKQTAQTNAEAFERLDRQIVRVRKNKDYAHQEKRTGLIL